MKHLWAILIPGPDDIFAMPDNEAANEAARKHNKVVDSPEWPLPDDMRASCYARVIIWPHGKREHAQAVKEWLGRVEQNSKRLAELGPALGMVSREELAALVEAAYREGLGDSRYEEWYNGKYVTGNWLHSNAREQLEAK